MENIITDLLTENRFWTFWSSDFSKSLSVRWDQKTKWSEVKEKVREHLGKDFSYERQVAITPADLVID